MAGSDKVLGIIVSNYPYGMGEPFLHEELQVLKAYYDRILIIVPEADRIDQSKMLFTLPEGVTLVPIHNRYTFWQKISALWRIGPGRFLGRVRTATETLHLKFSWSIFKIMMAYVAKEKNFRTLLSRELHKRDVSLNGLTLYTYWFTEYTLAIAMIKKRHRGIRAYSRMHGWDLYMERHNPPYLPFRRYTVPILDRTFPVSRHGLNYLVNKIQLPARHFSVQRLGVMETSLNTTPPIADTLRVISVAFLSPVKNVELLIEALARMQDITIHWIHIGDGDNSYAESIKQLAGEKLGRLSHIRYEFRGNLPADEVQHVLAYEPIDLLVNTSHSEGLPVSVMESFAHGIPVIAPAVGGLPEIICHEQNGFLLAEKPTADQLADALIRFCRLPEPTRIEMKKQAHTTWQNQYDAKHNYQRFADAMNGILAPEEIVSCTRCILNNQDYPDIRFDEQGVCDICHIYDNLYQNTVKTGEEGQRQLQQMIADIKQHGKGKEYDCLIGVSGGVDSTYLAYLCKQWGLRPLVLHVDNGWNAELAVSNIEKIVRTLGFELYTHVIDWEEMKDLQLAFLRASVVDIDIPTDNTYIASIYKIARKFGIKHILTGHNTVTEGWLPPNFNHNKYDLMNVRDIHRRFGTRSVRSVPLISRFGLWYNQRIRKIKTYSPLNYIDYNKSAVKEVITRELGWRDYGSKHFENIFTRFYQGYILPEKFHIDKRKAHLSTLVCSGQITREMALEEMKQPSYREEQYKEDREFFIKKMGLTEDEFTAIMHQPPVPHTAYKSELNLIRKLRPLKFLLPRRRKE